MANLDKIKISGVTYDIIDATAIHSMDGYWTSGQTTDAITAATSALAETIGQEMSAKTDNADFTAYTAATDAVLSGKVDDSTYTAYTAATDTVLAGKAETTAVTEAISEATSGKLDTSVFETYSGNVDTALASKIAGASWDSNTSHLNFYDNVSATGTPLTYVDGADWVKDSFLKSVTIEDKEISGETVTCLVFVFETESGETETDIPLTDIFDPDNYVSLATYTAYTAATDTVLQGKVDNSVYTAYTAATDATITGINATLTAHTADTTVHVTSSDKSTWSAKQNALSAGTGIDITNDVISVTGVPMTIDTQMSDSSTNPVQNNTIKAYVDTEVAKKNQVITIDGTTLVIS